MKSIRINYKLLLILYVFWILLTLSFTPINLIMGFMASLIATIASRGVLYDNRLYKYKIPKLRILVKYLIVLLIEIYKSSFSYILRVIKGDCNPVIIEVELEIEDIFVITMIANAITLTPGTITVDTNKNKLSVLSIKDEGEEVAKNIKEKFEKLFL